MGEDAGRGLVWVQDPATGETTGQITLTNVSASGAAGGRPAAGAESDGRGRPAAGGVRDWDQDRVDAEFFALVGDLVGAPHEIVDPVSGQVVGRATQTLYGQRSWRGRQASPLLFAGQYYDEESGWAYNRFRYYSPEAGIYNAQDPLGVSPRVASAQGYVDHAGHWFDFLGLNQCPATFNAERQIWEGANSNATGKNAIELRRNMKAKDMVPLHTADEAHHIVPARLNHGWMEDSRKIFDKFGLSPNDAANGEYLPKNAGIHDGDVRVGHHGSGVHSKAESRAIYEWIESSASKEDLVNRLSQVRDMHQSGRLMSDFI
ncbi:RHS repeat-associated core domain-containing protein [Corynebacterium cystitidis]|uniref:RHS repeat-associated core domain-containing protein n=1 Tax=Corynebacterium cystitidis TaxID=35757 RepID=UPI00211EF90D|nr:RHS repeat-associated core domain-containing protein [Corynebacterium cystitidis]